MRAVFLAAFRQWLLISLRVLSVLILVVSAVYVTGQPGEDNQTDGRPDQQATRRANAAFTFPNGRRQLLPDYRLVALYGAPGLPVLGALGEQPPAESMARAKALAAGYKTVSKEPVLPTIEIITTVASAEPTDNGDFSREVPLEELRPWIQAARAAGVYVVLDLQPGSTDFLTQAKQYEPLLREPHVGLALDPEWRLQAGKQHLVDIGSVGIAEVNQTAAWLADLTRQTDLPQKLLLLHQFRLSMIEDRAKLQAGQPELATIIQMDGQGAQTVKQETYRAISAAPPAGVRFGWKNFYQKDEPMLDPVQTMAQQPQPWYVSYQ